MASAGDDVTLKFAPLESVVDPGFWHCFSKAKLEVIRLDEKPVPLHGYFHNGSAAGLPCRFSLDFSAFELSSKTPHRCFRMGGTLFNTNTTEQFKVLDKQNLLNEEGARLKEAIESGEALRNPNELSKFLLLSFADLKKYRYYYWFAFPALAFAKPSAVMAPVTTAGDVMSAEQMSALLSSFDSFYESCGQAYFAVRLSDCQVLPLEQFDPKETMLGFCDPSTDPEHPGWPLRNLLVLVARCKISAGPAQQVRILCLRDRSKDGRRSAAHSLLLRVNLEPLSAVQDLKCVGWEKNHQGKLTPKVADLSDSMDPAKLADSSVRLNLELMRWRLLPELDLSVISATRCLVLGSGTLGCNAARLLMGWGVRQITMVDSGRVSFSNPVRQSLFTFDHSAGNGRHKAEAAVESMKLIYPGVDARAVDLSIPMPGHAVSTGHEARVRREVQRLEDLVADHDALFLLLDTREARWLPTLLGAARGKLVFNAALGFESFLVMRHGYRSPEVGAGACDSSVSKRMSGSELGCYFCSDVVAPGNSLRERTLDQQCTVSRPGLSMIASALVVELMVAVLQHPQKGAAPFCLDETATDPDLASSLGIVPHQIRGFLSRFSQVLPGAKKFDRCTGCSERVIQAYAKDGFDFLLKAFNDADYLADVAGLSELQNMNVDDILDFEDMEDVDSASGSI